MGSYRVVRQVRYCPPDTPSDVGLPWEPLELKALDGTKISAWFIRHPQAKGTLLLLHGFGTCKADLLDVARAFHLTGSFHLLMIDFRGHGFSGGKFISFGRKELMDIQAALDFLSHEPDLQSFPIGCYGISMGGSIALLAAATYPQIRAVVSDSAYADLAQTIARIHRMAYHIPRIPLGQVVIWGTECRLKSRMGALSPVNFIGKISPRPILLIHGALDRSIPAEEGRILFQAAGEPKEFWFVPGAEHVSSFYQNPSEYTNRVLEFFEDGLYGKT